MGIGVGIALVYTPAIACVQPWFTRRRGLAAGIASAGIGAGTLLVPLLVATALIAHAAVARRDAVLALGVLLLGLAAPRCCCSGRRRPAVPVAGRWPATRCARPWPRRTSAGSTP
jgi:MCP family monocarboxylic acid transporter-like MFS transporter 13